LIELEKKISKRGIAIFNKILALINSIAEGKRVAV